MTTSSPPHGDREGGGVNSLASPPSDPNRFEFIGHVDPPTGTEPGAPSQSFHYIGPRQFPLGVYMPKGYDLEGRPGDDSTWEIFDARFRGHPEIEGNESWTILRSRCCATGQVMTQWAMRHREERNQDVDGEHPDGHIVSLVIDTDSLEFPT